jgi:hypothetical protein
VVQTHCDDAIGLRRLPTGERLTLAVDQSSGSRQSDPARCPGCARIFKSCKEFRAGDRSSSSSASPRSSWAYDRQGVTTMAMQLSREACGGQDLVLPYPDTGNRVGQNVFAVVFFIVLISGPLIGIYAWSHVPGYGPAACWPALVWFGALGAGCSYMFGGAVVRMVVTARRCARGDGWLHLSSTGFDVHPRTGKLRRYEWREIDEFMLVESRDDEGGLVTQVGFRYSPERRGARGQAPASAGSPMWPRWGEIRRCRQRVLGLSHRRGGRSDERVAGALQDDLITHWRRA